MKSDEFYALVTAIQPIWNRFLALAAESTGGVGNPLLFALALLSDEAVRASLAADLPPVGTLRLRLLAREGSVDSDVTEPTKSTSLSWAVDNNLLYQLHAAVKHTNKRGLQLHLLLLNLMLEDNGVCEMVSGMTGVSCEELEARVRTAMMEAHR